VAHRPHAGDRRVGAANLDSGLRRSEPGDDHATRRRRRARHDGGANVDAPGDALGHRGHLWRGRSLVARPERTQHAREHDARAHLELGAQRRAVADIDGDPRAVHGDRLTMASVRRLEPALLAIAAVLAAVALVALVWQPSVDGRSERSMGAIALTPVASLQRPTT